MTGCKEEVESLFYSDDEIKAGDPVVFNTYMPSKANTRGDEKTAEQTAFETRMGTFKQVQADYEFTVSMYEKNVTNALGSACYVPTKTITNENTDDEIVTYASDGTLLLKEADNNNSLYWPGNAKEYGFMAVAGTETLETDQTSAEKLFNQDRLVGYGFEPLWDQDTNSSVDNEDALNYRTSKAWYTANITTKGMPIPGYEESAAFYKKIPLYLKHRRAKVTIILKAGEGVERTALAYEKAQTNIQTKIYTYKTGETAKAITPFLEQTTIDYGTSDDDKGVETCKYTAIIEPHDFLSGATSDVIAEIQLSGQRFTFYASNDAQYTDYTTNVSTAVDHMAGYNLTEGKHLTITATLGRDSRKIVITAYVVDWDETQMNSIVDDYGQTGDPIQITTREQLKSFLESSNNKAGNVAIIVPGAINLETNTEAWTPQPLNCTLNMAGATFFSTHQVFTTISSSGNLVNGTISLGTTAATTQVESAVANTNLGSIERVNVLTQDEDGKSTSCSATRAGLVVTNSGRITGCSSVLPVKSNYAGFIGGIAASSVPNSDLGTMPVIDGCTVNASVAETGNAGTKGGGIVGEALGRVINNTYEYGITISQNVDRFKNIIQCKAGTKDADDDLRAYGNSWPTTAGNAITKVEDTNAIAAENPNGTASDAQYTAVIDSQEELATILGSTYNVSGKRYRISNDFTVSSWDYGKTFDEVSSSITGSVFFELDGNDKTITTNSMLFTTIQNHVYDLTISLSDNLLATPVTGTASDGEKDAKAALAYSVYGTNGKISNIKVKGGNYRIQAKTAGGIVVWARGGATIEDCQCMASVQFWGDISSDAKYYAGGIVAQASQATITRCKYYNTSGTLYRNKADEYNTTSEAEETVTSGVYYGGIVGGITRGQGSFVETPSVLITDCSSWFTAESDQNQKGAILGIAFYTADDANKTLTYGVADGCQGNWWENSRAIGLYTADSSTKTIEQLIGKCNAVKPTKDSSF